MNAKASVQVSLSPEAQAAALSQEGGGDILKTTDGVTYRSTLHTFSTANTIDTTIRLWNPPVSTATKGSGAKSSGEGA